MAWRHLMPTGHLMSTRHTVLRLRAAIALWHLSLGHPRAHRPLARTHGRHPTHRHSYRTIGTHRHLWSHLTLHAPWTRHAPRAWHATWTWHTTWELLTPSHISSRHVWCHACRRSTGLLSALLGHPRAAIRLHSAHVWHVSSSRCSTASFGVRAIRALLLHGGFGVGWAALGGGGHLAAHAGCSRALPALWHGIVASTAVHVHAGTGPAGAAHHTHGHHVGPHVRHLTWHLHPLTNGSLMPHHGP